MKELMRYKNDIEKCSRCGLCQSVCPLYEIIKDEASLVRGKFSQLWGVLRGDLELNDKIINSLDLCLSCNKCKDFCPSDIDACSIFNAAKEDYYKKRYFRRFFNSKFIFKLKMLGLKVFSIFLKRFKINYIENCEDVIYFQGCINKSLNKKFPFKIKNGGFKCCGIPHLQKGRKDTYEEYKKYNIEISKKAKTILFDCASCLETFKGYGTDKKLVLINDLLGQNLKLKEKLKIAYHHPCHLKKAGIEEDDIIKFFENIENLEVVKFDDKCCGFSGDFFILHPILSNELSLKLAQNIENSNADIVISSCPTCEWSLNWGLRKFKSKKKIMNSSDFLSRYLVFE